MNLSPWLVIVIEACIAASCSAVTLGIVAFCMFTVFIFDKHRREDP